MEYTVEITLRASRPLTEETIFEVAELGGVVVAAPGQKQLETTLTVTASDVQKASARAIDLVTARVAGTVVAVEAMTTAEADRRAADEPHLVGVAEIAEMLKLSKQRVSTLSQRKDFPKPLVRLATGPVWRAGDLSTFAAGWRRQPGRPRKSPDANSSG
jgi:hypothetical protein